MFFLVATFQTLIFPWFRAHVFPLKLISGYTFQFAICKINNNNLIVHSLHSKSLRFQCLLNLVSKNVKFETSTGTFFWKLGQNGSHSVFRITMVQINVLECHTYVTSMIQYHCTYSILISHWKWYYVQCTMYYKV